MEKSIKTNIVDLDSRLQAHEEFVNTTVERMNRNLERIEDNLGDNSKKNNRQIAKLGQIMLRAQLRTSKDRADYMAKLDELIPLLSQGNGELQNIGRQLDATKQELMNESKTRAGEFGEKMQVVGQEIESVKNALGNDGPVLQVVSDKIQYATDKLRKDISDYSGVLAQGVERIQNTLTDIDDNLARVLEEGAAEGEDDEETATLDESMEFEMPVTQAVTVNADGKWEPVKGDPNEFGFIPSSEDFDQAINLNPNTARARELMGPLEWERRNTQSRVDPDAYAEGIKRRADQYVYTPTPRTKPDSELLRTITPQKPVQMQQIADVDMEEDERVPEKASRMGTRSQNDPEFRQRPLMPQMSGDVLKNISGTSPPIKPNLNFDRSPDASYQALVKYIMSLAISSAKSNSAKHIQGMSKRFQKLIVDEYVVNSTGTVGAFEKLVQASKENATNAIDKYSIPPTLQVDFAHRYINPQNKYIASGFRGSGFDERNIQQSGLVFSDKKANQWLYMFRLK
jgi:hypothetical protein